MATNGNGHSNGSSNGEGVEVHPPVDEAAEEDGQVEIEPVDPTFLVIRTLGRIELVEGGTDLGPAMLGKPVIAFIWLYLLVRALTDPDLDLDRAGLADEFSPGLSTDRQLKRLRDRLDDMVHRDLPPALHSRLRVTRKSVRLD